MEAESEVCLQHSVAVFHDGADSVEVELGRDDSLAELPFWQSTERQVTSLEGDQSLLLVLLGGDFVKVV